MSEISQSFQNMFQTLIQALPSIIAALMLLILAWIVAVVLKNVIQKLFVKMGVHKVLESILYAESEQYAKSILQSVGKIAYYLVFILFLPAILDALNMRSVSEPISNMMDKFLGFIPNIIAATITLIIGVFVAKLVKELFVKFFESLNLDRWYHKVNPNYTNDMEGQLSLTNILATSIYVLLLIPIVMMVLDILSIETVSKPIQMVFHNVISIIPNIVVSIILITIGYYLGKFLGNLLSSLLQGTGINNIYNSLGLSNPKSDIDLARLLGTVTQVLIILFFTVEALSVLNLQILNMIGSAIITYLPFLISALLILGIGLFLGNLLAIWIRKYTNSSLSAAIVKYVVIVFAVFMTLDQLQFAKTIVNIAFLLILGGLMTAIAISFGIGGRDFAKNQLKKLDDRLNSNDNRSS